MSDQSGAIKEFLRFSGTRHLFRIDSFIGGLVRLTSGLLVLVGFIVFLLSAFDFVITLVEVLDKHNNPIFGRLSILPTWLKILSAVAMFYFILLAFREVFQMIAKRKRKEYPSKL